MRRAYLLSCALVVVACSSATEHKAASSGAVFDGLSWVAPDHDGQLVLSWKPSATATQYRVYASLHPGRALKKSAVATTPGTTIVIAPEAKGARQYITVRAVDAKGLEDANIVEKSIVASPDTTPPTFAGAKTVAPLANEGATLSWDPATDDASPPEAISYDVYAGRTAQALVQLGRTGLGETKFELAKLGDPGQQLVFEVRARDIANNVSTNPKDVTAAVGGDAVPPTFAGCDAIANVTARTLTLSWKPATDDHSAPEALEYDVYQATAPGAQDFTTPRAKVTKGTSTDLDGLEPGKAYYFVCRARDAAGNADTNKVEKMVTTSPDVAPPTFGGLTTAVGSDVDQSVVLTWAAATDDITNPSKIVYDVYERANNEKYDFTAPALTTPPGTTTVTLQARRTRVDLYWVVRARDEVMNRDTNSVEQTVHLKTSFSRDVIPIFQTDCAVVGCHVTGTAPAGLNLSAGFAYSLLVNVNAVEKPPALPASKKRVAVGTADPLGDSWLNDKITKTAPGAGSQMPAPQTGNTLTDEEKGIIQSWILDGAPRN